jgi:transcriptional regulator with XRE-family HTH domain
VSPSETAGQERAGRPGRIDVHVGSRIRLRRTLLGLSQERLSDVLGLTAQQIQKYERGVNRIGALRLFDLSRVLDVPIGFFFDDRPNALPDARCFVGFAEQFGSDDETRHLVRAYYGITGSVRRKRVLELVKSLAPSDVSAAALD